jgi:hypothetical protein
MRIKIVDDDSMAGEMTAAVLDGCLLKYFSLQEPLPETVAHVQRMKGMS